MFNDVVYRNNKGSSNLKLYAPSTVSYPIFSERSG